MRRLRWGVLGVGGIASRRTIPEGILPSVNSELIAVMDPDCAAAGRAAAAFGARVSTCDEAELLSCDDVDAVYIASPAHVHGQQVRAAAAAGKHILCEKPLALTSNECYELGHVCHDAGVVLGVGFMMRWHGAHGCVKALIAQGALGQVVSVRAQLTSWYPPISGAWRQRRETGGGGALMDMGIHCVDLLRWLVGEVTHVAAYVTTQTHAYEVEDSATLLLSFASGAHGVVESFFNIPDAGAINALELYGTRGTVLARGTIGQDAGGTLAGYLAGSDDRAYDAQQARVRADAIQPISFDPVNTYRAEIEAFSGVILGEPGAVIPASEAARDLEVVEAAYRAAREGSVIRLAS